MEKITAKKKEKVLISFVDSVSSDDVTGSMIFIQTPNHKILLDAGLHQSNDKKSDFLVNNRKYKEFKPKDIDFLFISHNHGDHALLAPKLYRDGFSGATIVPYQTKSVLKRMVEDCAFINERDIEVINAQENKNYLPLYSSIDIDRFLEHTIEKPINEKIVIDNELSFMFVPSGHLLGSCQIMLYITHDNITESILYTGDLGNSIVGNKYVGIFEPVKKANLVIGESTYGDKPSLKTRKKERKNDLDKLKSIIDTQICSMKGRVVIPSFAQSRSQQLVNMIYHLYKDDPTFTYKIYVDSPLAIDIFKEYNEVLEGEELEDYKEMLSWDNLVFVRDPEQSKALVQSKEACCIISTAGMCNVGRVRHHLKSVISDPNATMLFVGYSTPGSLASLLKDANQETVSIDGKEYKIKCACYSLKSLSGHAPFSQLVDYYSSIQCNKIVLHHGSEVAKLTLKSELDKVFEEKCVTTRVVVANNSLKFSL